MTDPATLTISAAIVAYCADLPRQRGRRGRKSQKTVKTYAAALHSFATMLREQDRDLDTENASALTCADVVSFARAIADAGFSSATMNVYTTAVGRFYRWLLRQKAAGFTSDDLADLRDELAEDWRVSERQPLPALPDEGDVQAALVAAHETQPGEESRRQRLLALRGAAVFEVLRVSCARIGEVAGLKRKDVDVVKREAQVLGKGRKPRTVFLDAPALDAIAAYLAERDVAGLTPTDGEEPLFAQHSKKAGNMLLPIGPDALRSGHYRICESAGVADIHPHWMRHRGATEILRATHDLGALQGILGHENPATTMRYAHLDNDDLRRVHDAAEL